MRVPTNEPVIIKRLLDIGFYNFLIPFVETKRKQSRRWHQLVTHRKAFAASPFLTAPICLAPWRIISLSRTRTSLFWSR
ncbi:hypothetical protein DMI69_06155 [Escherichia coli]|nr:hypothetical protein [Escherichia coli]